MHNWQVPLLGHVTRFHIKDNVNEFIKVEVMCEILNYRQRDGLYLTCIVSPFREEDALFVICEILPLTSSQRRIHWCFIKASFIQDFIDAL